MDYTLFPGKAWMNLGHLKGHLNDQKKLDMKTYFKEFSERTSTEFFVCLFLERGGRTEREGERES